MQGNIVNITSIGGKVTVPHLLPYCCAKFAAVALSEGLSIELAPSGIRVTTIVPGLMRTGSHLNAQFKGRQSAEYGWFAAGAATPAISISAERSARSIVSATARGQKERILSLPAEVLANFSAITPSLSRAVLSAVNHFLPKSGDVPSEAIPGRSLETNFTSTIWKTITRLGQDAAVSLNEIVPPGCQENFSSNSQD
jgi:short-subunit dehydrogenase